MKDKFKYIIVMLNRFDTVMNEQQKQVQTIQN
jgi:hypothetical protein